MKAHFIKISISFALLGAYFSALYAQQGDTLFIQRNDKGKIEFARFAIDSQSNRKMQNDTIFLKAILQAKQDDEFRLKNVTTDELGITSKRFQQYYRGVIVENAEYLLHGKDGNIEYVNGDFHIVNIQTVLPTLNEQQALLKALKYVDAEKYYWEDSDKENFIKQHSNDTAATYYPKGKLVIAKDYLIAKDSFKLSWKFAISALKPYSERMIFVDAISGKIIQDNPLIINANTPGTAQTLYSVTQGITCDSYSGGYRLFESRNTTSGNSVTLHTLNKNGNEISNANTNWTSGSWANFNQNRHALDVHWGMEKVIDYFKNVHNRNGIDPTSVPYIKSYVYFNVGHANAGWYPSMYYMDYGDGDGIILNPLTSVDIVAHEVGHGITQFSSNLYYYSGESGPLNEGFSDIWSVCVKNYVNSTMGMNKSLWLCGNEVFIPNNSWGYNCIRDLQNPKSSSVYGYNGLPTSPSYRFRCPDTYMGTNWDPGNQPHTNSTILSHWFYILSVGKSGINDNNHIYNVMGIGINKAEKIAYKTLLNLHSTANYAAARNVSIQAAINLYGNCSQEVIDVTNAWYAVGVGNQYSNLPTVQGVIATNTTWSTPVQATGTVIILKGKTLTIATTVECHKNARIIVEPGAKLIVNGGTLTSICYGILWKGIEVQGNINQIQSPTYQGVVELKNGATIENAVCGISVVNKNGILFPPFPLSSKYGGGIIQATDAYFVNNTQAVCFARYKPILLSSKIPNNPSYFKGCRFTINMLSNKAQVELNDVNGILFENCEFSNNFISGIPGLARLCDGIYANNSSIRVGRAPLIFNGNGCTFSGFNRAIYLKNSGINQSQIYSSNFNNNYTGIIAEGTRNLRVGNCKFDLPIPNSTFPTQNHTGIYLKKSSLYRIENNRFTGYGLYIGGFGGTGVVSESSGINNHLVKNNTFRNLCTGVLAIGENGDGSSNNLSQGLVYQCNAFERNGDDISVAANSKIRFLQSGDDITTATGNTFLKSKTNISYREQYYNLKYQYRLNTPNQYPSSVLDPYGNVWLRGVNKDKCTGYGYMGNLYYLIAFAELPTLEREFVKAETRFEMLSGNNSGNGGNGIDWDNPVVMDIVEQLDGEVLPTGELVITINGNPPSTPLEEQVVLYYQLTHLKQEMDDICYAALEVLGSDEEGLDITEYRKWVGRFNTIESEYLLVDVSLDLGEFAQARTILDAMPAKFPELDAEAYLNYRDYLAVVQNISILPDDEEIPIHLINELVRLSSNDDFVSIKAYSLGEVFVYDWVELYPNTFTMHPACVCNYGEDDGKGGKGSKGKKSADGSETLEEKISNGVQIYPNPTAGELRVTSNGLRIEKVEIYDIVGRKLSTFQLSTLDTKIDISALSSGMYFITITDENQFKVTKKIVKE